jgi:hypothetical protein
MNKTYKIIILSATHNPISIGDEVEWCYNYDMESSTAKQKYNPPKWFKYWSENIYAKDISEIKTRLNKVEERLNKVEARLDKLEFRQNKHWGAED